MPNHRPGYSAASRKDYLAIHNWFDETKACHGDFRHRALRHHTFGIMECVKTFGEIVVNSDGKKVAVRYVAEQHVLEDCGGKIPSVSDWLDGIAPKSWMARAIPTFLKHGTREKPTE
jgi:hypothetical protein